MYENRLYTIKTLSNLHVGGGDVNYSVIDKQVQRDALTHNPTIHASSFKGAMREYIKYTQVSKQDLKDGEPNPEAQKAGDHLVYTVFGQEPKLDQTQSKKPKAGHVIFSEVKLLSLPVRTNKIAFMYATCPSLIKDYNHMSKMYGLDTQINEFCNEDSGYFSNEVSDEIVAEELDFKLRKNDDLSVLQSRLGKSVILFTDGQFRDISKSLPVMARNHLENGESQNLFYEEVVPRESLFYTVISYPNDNLLSLKSQDIKSKKNIVKFQNAIKDTSFYLGANTTIGQGYCRIRQIEPRIASEEEGDHEQSPDQ